MIKGKYKFIKRKSLSYSILKALALSGMIVVAISNPRFGRKLFSNINKILKSYDKKKRRQKFYRSLCYLQAKKFISLKELNNGKFEIKITSAGQGFIGIADLNNFQIEKPKKWDGKYRLIIFDIPRSKHQARIAFLRKLKEAGFLMIQKSVWVHPYDCINEIIFLRRILEIESYVKIVLVDAIEGDYKIRKHFNL